jgi:two-component system, sensor histidine kinase ChiS
LAEKSGVWRITIDDGRLRTRTLNRYLDLAALPARPRWREVLRTAYFVLAECALDAGQRDQINQRIGVLQQQMRGSVVAGTDRRHG